MSTRKRIILTTALTGLTLLAADMTELRAERRVARIAAASQESQQFQSLLNTRIALRRRQTAPVRIPRLLLQLRWMIATLTQPMPLLEPDPDLAQLQRYTPGRRTMTKAPIRD